MGTWQIVGSSWKLAVQGLAVAGIVAGFSLLVGLAALPFADEINQGTVTGAVVGIALGLVNFFLWPMMQGGCLTFASTPSTQDQQPKAVQRFWEGAGKLYGRLLGCEALIAAMALVLAVVAVALFLIPFAFVTRSMALSVVLALVATVPVALGAYGLFLIPIMAPVAIAVDGTKVFGAIKRGLKVGRAALGKLVLVVLALTLTVLPAFVIVMIPGFLIASGVDVGVAGRIAAVLLQSLLSGFSTVLFIAAFIQVYRLRAGSA
jgi:hypothetical protein